MGVQYAPIGMLRAGYDDRWTPSVLERKWIPMARKVIVSLVGDFDGTSDADETVTFGIDEAP